MSGVLGRISGNQESRTCPRSVVRESAAWVGQRCEAIGRYAVERVPFGMFLFTRHWLSDLLWSHLDLRHNVNLRSIYLDYDHMYERCYGEAESLRGHVLALLSQITSHSIMEIRLRCEPIVMEVLKEDV